MAPPAGRRYRIARLCGGGRRRPVVLSQARMDVPVGEGPLGNSQDDQETFHAGRRFAPAVAVVGTRPDDAPACRPKRAYGAEVGDARWRTEGSTATWVQRNDRRSARAA
jgi:hypothetical protein